MRLALAVASVCSLAACAAEPEPLPASGLPPVPVRLPCSLGDDDGRAHAFRMTLERELEQSAAAGAHAVADLFAESPGTVTDVLGLATRRDPVRIRTIVTCPDAAFLLGRGVVIDLVVGLATAIDSADRPGGGGGDDLRSVILRGAYASWHDGWRIHVTPPRDAFDGMRVLHTDAEVWASISRRWVTVEVTMTAVVDDGRLVLTAPPLEAAVVDSDAPLHNGFRLVEARVGDRRADVVLGTGGYLVIGGLGRGPEQVRLRYQGPLPLIGDNQAELRVLELHRWLPTVPYADVGPVELTVHHPIEDTLVASLPSAGDSEEERGDTGTWRIDRFAGLTDRDPSLLLVDGAPMPRAWDDGRGSRIELLASPALPIDACAPALARIVGALAPLGPVGRVRVLAVPAVYGRHGRRADDLIVVLRAKLVDLCTPIDDASAPEVRRRHRDAVALIAHELAHGWFGRQVRAADDEASAWWEAAAEYVSTWAVDEVGAAELRRGWLDDYAEAAHRDLFAMAQRIPTAGDLHDALSYDKGALLLTALEDRIGRDRIAAVLRHYVTAHRGQLGSWLDLVSSTQAIAGSSAAAWLHRWLFSIGAPELTVAGLRVDGARLHFAIAQDDPAFDASVDVAVFRGDRLLLYAKVPLSGARTETDLELPAGADRLVLDPWSRLPRFGIAEAAIPRAATAHARW